MENKKNNYWYCEIGPVNKEEIPFGGDWPMRQAVRNTFIDVFKYDAPICSSGWGLDPDTKGILERIRLLCITNPSGEKIKKILEILNNQDEKI